MDVILKSNVDGLGQRGDVVSVSNGYYRNYLLPQGLGYKATKGAQAEAEAMRKASAARNAESRADADLIATQLVPQVSLNAQHHTSRREPQRMHEKGACLVWFVHA